MGQPTRPLSDLGSYGRSFADVYDAWYDDISDVTATVARVHELSNSGRVLELGVGTGRIALPLVSAGLEVVGIDASSEMLDALRTKDTAHRVHAVFGDMADLPFAPTFSLVLVAFNTLFNLAGHDRIETCFAEVARVLLPDGAFVVEAFVPPLPGEAPDDGVSVREIRDDAVVLTAATRTHHDHLITGSHIEIGPAGVRLRPWRLCYATPGELDAFATLAGLELATRHGGWHAEPYDHDSTTHVCVYRKGS
ncbi:MAG TPA: class I SAM-dependent methyltransferase [Acidimicrobiales bacterium]|nr:class I SAM-dependent methyltransferase [Acidimicrobiales bacterium]